MSRRLKVFLVLALCALAQSVSSKMIKNDLLDPKSPDEGRKSELSATNEAGSINVNVLVSIPPSENRSAQIMSSELTMSGENSCLLTIIADQICNKSSNTSGPCASPNKEPELIVTLVGTVNYGKPHIYRTRVTGGALVLTIVMEEDLVIEPKYYPELGNTTIYLNFLFESFQSIDKMANSSDVFVIVQTLFTPTSPPTSASHSGQTGLCPLYGVFLLMLLPVFLNP